jgi:hypothetical protein
LTVPVAMLDISFTGRRSVPLLGIPSLPLTR